MTKKYEKFEVWMIGKEVKWDNQYGVVVEEYSATGNCVWVEWRDGDTLWIEVSCLEFLNVEGQQTTIVDKPAPSEHAPIPWEVGQTVWDTRFTHQGVVIGVDTQFVSVRFGTKIELYFLDGKSSSSMTARRVLFFSEPVVTAEAMPPKKPFVPKLKEGVKVLIKDKQGLFGEGTVRVVHKECDDRVYVSKDGVYFMKYDIESLQVIGEEIKWEN